jgi:diguanylate cyclase (GGDEF)-like protein
MPKQSVQDTISQALEQSCATEPIHIIGTVQPHGFVVVVDIESARIVQVSSGAARHWPGLEQSANLLNAQLADRVVGLGQDPAAMLRSLPWSDPVPLTLQPRGLPHKGDASAAVAPTPDFECVGHRVGGLAILEWQAAVAVDDSPLSDAQVLNEMAAALARLRTAKGLAAFFKDCVAEVARLSGFDRVMLYRFLPDWSGEVIAEQASVGLETRFLGLRFPASDIPSQARALYTNSRIRVLADVEAVEDRLQPALLDGDLPLDQGHSLLRGFSEVHRSYLRNMGVRATMSLSIVCDGELWGLIACHHYIPRSPPHHVRNSLRQVCELVAGVCAMRIEALEKLALAKDTASLERLLVNLHRAVLLEEDTAAVLARMLPELLAAFQASGLCVRIGNFEFVGGCADAATSNTELLDEIAALFEQPHAPASILQHSDLLAPGRSTIRSLPTAAGLLGAQLSDGGLEFCAFVRPELVCEVHWAGEPAKVLVPAADGRVRLEPRRSFAVWREEIAGTARPWLSSESDACQRLLVILSDARKRRQNKKLEEEMQWRAQHDHLTGLINRRSIEESLDQFMGAGRYDSAVILIDLDHFKMVNDTHGHAAGDRLLRELSQRLQTVMRPADLLSRVGGDEFLLLARISRSDKTLAMAIADRLQKVMEEPFVVNGQLLRLGLSIGISIPPGHGTNATDLMRRADLALFKAKSEGRSTTVIFDEKLEENLLGAYEMELDLNESIANNELSLVFQPEVDLVSGRVVALEALARWNSPKRGVVRPIEFIPLAERSRLIIHIGRWVLRTVIAAQSDWRRRGLLVLPVAVNVSMAEIAAGDLATYISATLEEFHMPTECISVELTESVIMKDLSLAANVLRSLRELGVAASLDDFGTGYSSLSYLRQLPLTALKVDQSFTAGLPGDSSSCGLTHAIIRMAEALSLITIAEGVETSHQLHWLRDHGCTIGQGYLFSRPVAPELIHATVDRIEATAWSDW